MKKLVSVVIFFIGGSVLIAIIGLIGCGKTQYHTIYKDIALHFVKSYIDSNNYHIITDTLQHNDTVIFDTLIGSFTLESNVLACKDNLHFGNNAYAMEIDPASYHSLQEITSLKIYCLNNYNQQFHSGDDIADSILYYSNYSNDISVYLQQAYSKDSIISFLNDPQSGQYYIANKYIEFVFTSPPSLLSLQQFVIELKTEDGIIMRDTSAAIFIRP